MRIGCGFDVHRLVEGRTLVLGGVDIPHEHGLAGHSDADVLSHAITDALLGAANLGDIGVFFPDDESRWEGADSLMLLSSAYDTVRDAGFSLRNVDSTIALENPKLRPHVHQMQNNIAGALNVSASQVSVKATSTERLGFVGRAEGAAAYAVVLLNNL